jgi:hypothetical protein
LTTSWTRTLLRDISAELIFAIQVDWRRTREHAIEVTRTGNEIALSRKIVLFKKRWCTSGWASVNNNNICTIHVHTLFFDYLSGEAPT